MVRRRRCGHRWRWRGGGGGQDGHAVGGLQRGARERSSAVPSEPSDRQERASDNEGSVARRRRRHGKPAADACVRRHGGPAPEAVELVADAKAAQEAVPRQENQEPKSYTDLTFR
ncbi:hypothetical protein PR202_gb16863 [Eleusine coracana subsp. coracana]|uniref:Uncharacterized protein n=1 Tax=Eleusine coracana subsp. coracana TaxID=191504 RepID=A0AAV5F1H8_ELECO|nr:hypothetical protein PR202_gb16863 [Eleusine coracana subsp. coracana]